MNNLIKIYTLKNEVQAELYQWFDKEVRQLTKNSNGVIDPYANGLADNDVDAMRHAYVSGVYTLEYGTQTAEILGRLNELKDFDSSSTTSEGSENMDLWNNAVGRRIAKRIKTRRELFEALLKIMKKGGLIVQPLDSRKYKGEKKIKQIPKSFVIKIKEEKTGANIEFLDIHKKVVMTKEDFIMAIKEGKYPGYGVRKHESGEIPYSIRDRFRFNNLG